MGDRMKNGYLLIVLFFSLNVSSQTVKTRVGGVLQDINSKIGIKDVAVFLIENSDTISRSCTDSTGQFQFDLVCSAKNDYSIGYIYDGRKYKKVQIGIVYDSTELMEYYLELGIFMQSESKKNELSEFYAFDQTKKDSLVDLYWLKQFLDEYPTIYLEYRQFVNPNENKRIYTKRYKDFVHLLKIAKIDCSKIKIDYEPIVLSNAELTIDPRSRFSGKLIAAP